MTREGLWIGLIVLFLAGALTGIVGTMLYCRYEQEHRWEQGPGARQERVMKKLAHELSLTSSQREALKPIVAHAHLELLTLRVRHQPEVGRILTDGMKDMKTTLSPEQQSKLDALYAQLQRRWSMSRDFLRDAEAERK
jgi:hypothetical protein